VEKGPSWPATASEVTGAGEVVGVLRRGVLYGLEETTVELSVASMPEQGKRKARKSRLGCAHKGKRGGSGAGDATWRQGENGARPGGRRASSAHEGRGRRGGVWSGWAIAMGRPKRTKPILI
jgi:hypothetical protein